MWAYKSPLVDLAAVLSLPLSEKKIKEKEIKIPKPNPNPSCRGTPAIAAVLARLFWNWLGHFVALVVLCIPAGGIEEWRRGTTPACSSLPRTAELLPRHCRRCGPPLTQ